MRVLAIGAHPDDCEIAIGGTAALWGLRGDEVHFVSLTDGCRGHYRPEYHREPALLIERRQREAAGAAAIVGASYECLGMPDGEVFVTPGATEAVVQLIRRVGPDLVLCHRPVDYHRDHRYTARLVLDAAYMLTVPFYCPAVPHLARMPIIASWWDEFRESGRFRRDVTVPLNKVWDTKVAMVAAHESQFYEWLPYNRGVLDAVPADQTARRAWLGEWLAAWHGDLAARCGLAPTTRAEAFQISEYGRQPLPGELRDLFPPGARLRQD